MYPPKENLLKMALYLSETALLCLQVFLIHAIERRKRKGKWRGRRRKWKSKRRRRRMRKKRRRRRYRGDSESHNSDR